MKPIDTAGKGIAAILELKEENRQLRNDLEKMTTAKNGAFKLVERLQDENREMRNELIIRKHENQDYTMLAGLILWVWAGFMGIVVYS